MSGLTKNLNDDQVLDVGVSRPYNEGDVNRILE